MTPQDRTAHTRTSAHDSDRLTTTIYACSESDSARRLIPIVLHGLPPLLQILLQSNLHNMHSNIMLHISTSAHAANVNKKMLLSKIASNNKKHNICNISPPVLHVMMILAYPRYKGFGRSYKPPAPPPAVNTARSGGEHSPLRRLIQPAPAVDTYSPLWR